MYFLLTLSASTLVFIILTLDIFFFNSILSKWEIYLSILAILISVINFLVARRDRGIDKISSISDAFWFRLIIVPQLLEPLNKICEYVYLWNSNEIVPEEFLEIFQNKKRILVHKTSLCAVLDEALPDRLICLLDDFEDHITGALFPDDKSSNNRYMLLEYVNTFNISYLRVLYQYHPKI